MKTLLMMLFLVLALPNSWAKSSEDLVLSDKKMEPGRAIKISHPSIVKGVLYNVVFTGQGVNFQTIVQSNLSIDGEFKVFVPSYMKDDSLSNLNTTITVQGTKAKGKDFEILSPPRVKKGNNISTPVRLFFGAALAQVNNALQSAQVNTPTDLVLIKFLEDTYSYYYSDYQILLNRAPFNVSSIYGAGTLQGDTDYDNLDRILATNIAGLLEYLGEINYPKNDIDPTQLMNWFQKVSAHGVDGYNAYQNNISSLLSIFPPSPPNSNKKGSIFVVGAVMASAIGGLKYFEFNHLRSIDLKNQAEMEKQNLQRLITAVCAREGKDCAKLRGNDLSKASCPYAFIDSQTVLALQLYRTDVLGGGPTACLEVTLISPPNNGGGAIVRYDTSCSSAPAGIHKIVLNAPGVSPQPFYQCGAGGVADGAGLSGGDYTASVTVYDINGNADTETVGFTIPGGTGDLPPGSNLLTFEEMILKPFRELINKSITAVIQASTTHPPLHGMVTFSSGSVSSAYILNYAYSFSDGGNISRCYDAVTKTYNTAGNYTATLTVTNNLGESSTSAPLAITVGGSGDK